MDIGFVIDVICNNRGTKETLYDYRVKHPETVGCCLFCGRKLSIEPRYFCEGETVRPLHRNIGIAKCAYEFYCKHPEMILEWTTQ
jgi:hypothetical protein